MGSGENGGSRINSRVLFPKRRRDALEEDSRRLMNAKVEQIERLIKGKAHVPAPKEEES